MSGEDLRALRVKHKISQAAMARRMRLTTRSRLSTLEQQKYVTPGVTLRYADALLKEQHCQDTGIDLDYDPEDWGLPTRPAKPLEMEYHGRPRDKRGRWLPWHGRIPQQPEVESEPERPRQKSMPTSDNAVRVVTDVLGRPPRNAAEMREALRILHVRQQEERQREEKERENSPGAAVVSDIRWDLGHVIEEQEPTAGEEASDPWEDLPEGGAEVIDVRWQR